MANQKKRTLKKQSKTEYVAVSDNIYKSNESYRVRVTINGVRHSKNFNSQRKAIQWRNQLRREAA